MVHAYHYSNSIKFVCVCVTLFIDASGLDDVRPLYLGLDEGNVHLAVRSGLGLRLQHGVGAGEGPW